MEDLLLGFVADGAGVVEDEAGFLLSLDLAVALGQERADDLFRVMDVHLAAKGLNVERFLRALSHSCQYNAGKEEGFGTWEALESEFTNGPHRTNTMEREIL